MRVLIAGRNAQGLAKAAGAIPHDLTIATATTKAAALYLLERAEFDLVIACEKLGDGLGLEVLSHVTVNTPNTLRVFAARPSTLQALKNELGFFGLFRTFPYPINFRKLWATLNLAGSCCVEPDAAQVRSPPKPRVHQIRHVVLDSSWEVPGHGSRPGVEASPGVEVIPRSPASARVPTVAGAHAPAGARAKAGDLAVISSSETVRVTAVRPRSNGGAAASAPRRVPQSQSAPIPVTTAARVMTDRPPPAVSGGVVANGRPPAAAARPTNAIQASPPARRVQASSVPVARPPSRIPESEAFKRARARRNEAREQREPPATNGAATSGPRRRRRESPVANGAQRRREPAVANGAQGELSAANGQKRRREPSLANESLAQLARLATTRRPTYDPRSSMPGSRRRKALFVGSGVFAGGAAALLTFFMIGTNSSIGQSSVPVATSVAAIDHPVPQSVLPWQAPSAPQSTTTSFARNQTVTPPIDADMEVEAEAASEPVGIEPGHPGPPGPIAPPPPAEPPTLYDASGMPLDE